MRVTCATVPAAIYECGCADIPEGDCDCRRPARRLTFVERLCQDLDNGICDDVDDCVGEVDADGNYNTVPDCTKRHGVQLRFPRRTPTTARASNWTAQANAVVHL